MALTYSNDFFAGKRPWSLIKDEILTNYLPPYLKKVNKLNRRIVLVDGFAGPGRFDDGSYGSPYFMCKTASEIVPNNYLAVLVNKDKKHHLELTNLLQDYIKNKCGFTLKGTAQDLLKELSSLSPKSVQNKSLQYPYSNITVVSFENLEKVLPSNPVIPVPLYSGGI